MGAGDHTETGNRQCVTSASSLVITSTWKNERNDLGGFTCNWHERELYTPEGNGKIVTRLEIKWYAVRIKAYKPNINTDVNMK